MKQDVHLDDAKSSWQAAQAETQACEEVDGSSYEMHTAKPGSTHTGPCEAKLYNTLFDKEPNISKDITHVNKMCCTMLTKQCMCAVLA